MASSFIPTDRGVYVALEVSTLAAEAVLHLLQSLKPGFARLGNQAKESAPSVPLNLAESLGYIGKQRKHFEHIAHGSAKEALQTVRILRAACAVPYGEAGECIDLLDRCAALTYRVVYPRHTRRR